VTVNVAISCVQSWSLDVCVGSSGDDARCCKCSYSRRQHNVVLSQHFHASLSGSLLKIGREVVRSFGGNSADKFCWISNISRGRILSALLPAGSGYIYQEFRNCTTLLPPFDFTERSVLHLEMKIALMLTQINMLTAQIWFLQLQQSTKNCISVQNWILKSSLHGFRVIAPHSVVSGCIQNLFFSDQLLNGLSLV